MTLAVEIPAVETYASGAQVAFPITFTFEDVSEIVVSVQTGVADPEYKVRGTHFEVSGDGLLGTGIVTFYGYATPVADDLVRILRSTPLEQPASYGDSGNFQPSMVARTADRLTRIAQELRYLVETTGVGGGGGGGAPASWSTLGGKPSTFPPSAHSHAQSEITGLVEELMMHAHSDLSNITTGVFKAKLLASGGVALASGAGVTAPVLSGQGLKALRVNAAETAYEYYTPAGGGGGTGTVDSVNGQGPDGGGDVTLTATDVGAAETDLSNTALTLSTGEALTLPDIEGHRVSVLKFIPTALHAAILAKTSAVSVTAYIREAIAYLDSRAGGILHFPAGLYRHTKPTLIPSNITFEGDGIGATEIRSIWASWDGSELTGLGEPSASYHLCMFLNENFTAASITDKDIGCRHLTISHNSSVGGAHNWLMRMVDRPRVADICTRDTGGSGVALLATRDAVVFASLADECYNSGFDNWDGFRNTKILNCTVRGCSGQAIQGTGTGGFYEDRTSYDFLVQGCSVYDCHAPSGFGVAFIANVVDTGSNGFRAKFVGNHAEDCDIGMALGGHGGGHLVLGATLRACTTQSFIIQDESGGGTGETPDDCVVCNLIIDSPDDGSEPASIVVHGGARHVFMGVHFIGTVPTRRFWFAADTTDIEVHPVTGSSAPFADLDSGSGNTFYAYGGGGGGGLTAVEANFTPTLYYNGVDSGATYVQRAGRYIKVGNLIYFALVIELSAKGGGSSGDFVVVRTGLTFPPNSTFNSQLLVPVDGNGAFAEAAGIIGTVASATQFGVFPRKGGAQLTQGNVTSNQLIRITGSFHI